MNILGISAFFHDSAAALVQDGVVSAAAQEERFSRRKHDAMLPVGAMRYCLEEGRVGKRGLDAVVFFEKPLTKFVRLLKTYSEVSPGGFGYYRRALLLWAREKLWIPLQIEKALRSLGYAMPKDLFFTEHHESHAASAFYPSPFPSAAILTMDAVGEWATASIGVGNGADLRLLRELRFPHSLGMLYSAFTEYCGFRVNSGEYKLMGLAAYGEPVYADKILDHLVDVRPDGSFRLDMSYFGYLRRFSIANDAFADLFGGPPRAPETEITQREADLAASVQAVTEEIVMRMAGTAARLTGERHLCLAGGVALNAVANGRLAREGPFEQVWVPPAAGDAGGAVGSALSVWHQVMGNERHADGESDGMQGAYLGPAFAPHRVRSFLLERGYPFDELETSADRARRVAELLADGKIVGVFMGRMEFGPRALGHRSILADPRSRQMQSELNRKIKFRESFRPFAPSVLAERAADYFEGGQASPFMTFVSPVVGADRSAGTGIAERLEKVDSAIPAVTHVDGSARLQTVTRERNPDFHEIISAFEARTGCGLVINTSFNVRGEPIVCTPADAYATFMATGLDYLVLESCLLDKRRQPAYQPREEWLESLVLD